MINENYYRFNYWNITLTELPTHGWFYNQNVVIKARSLSLLEVKLLATLNPENATAVCNEILSKCLYLENIKLEELLLADREYLIFWIRLNSFTQSSGYSIDINECQHCHEKFTAKISLNEFDVRYIKQIHENVYLPDLNIKIDLKMPMFNDSGLISVDEINELALWLDTNNTQEDKIRFIETLSALDFIALKNCIDDMKCGIKHELDIECPLCHSINKIGMILNDESLFGSVNLLNILETITRIAKYSNIQITNDWTWPEVEAEQLIINKMIQEENEANDKEMRKAKSQMAAARAGMPSTASFATPRF